MKIVIVAFVVLLANIVFAADTEMYFQCLGQTEDKKVYIQASSQDGVRLNTQALEVYTASNKGPFDKEFNFLPTKMNVVATDGHGEEGTVSFDMGRGWESAELVLPTNWAQMLKEHKLRQARYIVYDYHDQVIFNDILLTCK